MAKQIIDLKPRVELLLKSLDEKVRSARTSNDYILINFGRKNEFIRVDFARDQSYGISHNIYNPLFISRLNVFVAQYKITNIYKITNFLFEWINKLNN